MASNLECKVYVGDLPRDVSEHDIDKEFSAYGRLKKVWVARNPPGFAFVEYEDHRDAEDAIKGLDGRDMFGSQIRVEPSSGKSRVKPWQRDGRGPPPGRYRDDGPRRRAFNPDDECFKCGRVGHYAYDCHDTSGRSRYDRGGRGRSTNYDHQNQNHGAPRSGDQLDLQIYLDCQQSHLESLNFTMSDQLNITPPSLALDPTQAAILSRSPPPKRSIGRRSYSRSRSRSLDRIPRRSRSESPRRY